MSTSLAQLITQVRQRGDMENNNFVSDSELTGWINNSLAELDDILVTRYEDYRLTNFLAVLPAGGGTNIISIPSDMNKLRGVDYQNNPNAVGQQQWYTLFSFFLF